MRNPSYVLLVLFSFLRLLSAQTPKCYSYQILYTGRTLGYARIPDEQTLPTNPGGSPSVIANEFLAQFHLAERPGAAQFRIAMGDNFSPDLYGRSIRVDSGIEVPSCDEHPDRPYSSDIHLPKDYFTYDPKGWHIWCNDKVLSPENFSDNVANFLDRAKYDAIVPGKHDLYFAPQYLRQIARYLRENTSVKMLGDNLVITSSLAPGPLNAHQRLPERLAHPCHLDTGGEHECYHTDFGPASLDLPDTVLPWKRQFVLHGARSAYIRDPKLAPRAGTQLFRKDELPNFKDSAADYHPVFDPKSIKICVEPGSVTGGDPAKVLFPYKRCMKLVASDVVCNSNAPAHLQSTCKALYSDDDPKKNGIYDEKSRKAGTDITFLFANPGDHLVAGLNHMFCATPAADFLPIFGNDAKTEICQPLPVALPMFWPDPRRDKPPLGMDACAHNPALACPYALVDHGGVQVAIFAVVDPDLLSNVGMLNAGWFNDANRGWDTAVQVTAPDYALLQTLDLCNATEECRNAPKILMAQMSYARAKQLISNSNFNSVFDVVVTQASPEHDTGMIEAHYQGKTPRFALTPPEPITPDSLTGCLVKDATVCPATARSLPSFTPQVYVATIEKSEPPRVVPRPAQAAPPSCLAKLLPRDPDPCAPSPPSPKKTVSSRPCQPAPAGQFSLASPDSDYSPPDANQLPSQPAFRDFGSVWSLRNASARWDVSLPGHSPSAPQNDLQKFSTRQARPFCPGREPGPGKCLNLQRLALDYLSHHKIERTAQDLPIVNPAASDPLTQAVLIAMRNALRTDAAIIQTRDLYDADNLSLEQIDEKDIQDQISQVVWKGDEVIVLHVTGATIRKLLKQSATFAQLDKNSLNTEIEKGRDLITLGIYAHPKDSDTYYINGAIMSDTALYSIAATDFISGGDTGYSNLVPPDVLPAYRIRDFARKQVRPIAGLVCKELVGTPKDGPLPCADMRLAPKYFDEKELSPTDATPGFTTPLHYRSFWRNFFMPRRPYPYSEDWVQQHPFWYLKLENLDFSESGVFINHFAETTSNLAGLSNPLIANKGAQNIGADHKARFVFDYQQGTLYALTDSSFSYTNTVSSTPSTSGPPTVTSGPPTLAYNVLGLEAGGTLRLPVPRNRIGLRSDTPNGIQRPSWLSLQYSIRYERELVNPFDTQITLTPTAPPASPVTDLVLHTPQISTIYGRGGLRAENSDTYLEFGIEDIDARGLLQSYTIPQAGTTYNCVPRVSSVDLLCSSTATSTSPPVDIKTLALTANSYLLAVSPQTTAYLTPGVYLNFYWKFPIWSRRDANRADQSFYLTLTNKGDFYFKEPSDTPVQTRYLDKLTPALNFPIWAGLTLTPKVDFILYENKVNFFHYRSVQPSVALSYTFTWREGMGFVRALRYGAQTTTPSPAGTTH